MTVRQPRYSKAEIAQRGTEIYERDIRPHVEKGNDGKIVAIDVETGDYEMDEDDYAAVARLRARKSAADIWLMCAGYPTTYRIGAVR